MVAITHYRRCITGTKKAVRRARISNLIVRARETR
jgi:hypothetical protein